MAVEFLSYFKKPVFLSSLICAFIFYSGIFVFPQKSLICSLLNESDITEISGIILSSPSRISNGRYYRASFSSDAVKNKEAVRSSASGRLQIFIPSELAEAFAPGKLYSEGKKNNSGKNPVFLYESGGHYVFSGRLTEKGFYVHTCTDSFWPPTWLGRLARFRAVCRLHFKRLMYGWGSGGGLLLALLCGAREYTDTGIQNAFRRAGLSHILALSGMHLSMFSAIAVFFGKRGGIKKLTFILRITLLAAFVWFAGFSPSLTRAFICALLMIAASIAGARKPDTLSVLSFSFLIQSAICPYDIQETAFILSYGALSGILLFSRFFSIFYSKFFPRWIASSFSAATGAQTVTAPLSLRLFGSFSPIGIVSSTIVTPFITFFIYSGLVLIILCLIFPFLAKPSGFFINLQYTVINYIVKIFSLVPNWSIN